MSWQIVFTAVVYPAILAASGLFMGACALRTRSMGRPYWTTQASCGIMAAAQAAVWLLFQSGGIQRSGAVAAGLTMLGLFVIGNIVDYIWRWGPKTRGQAR